MTMHLLFAVDKK